MNNLFKYAKNIFYVCLGAIILFTANLHAESEERKENANVEKKETNKAEKNKDAEKKSAKPEVNSKNEKNIKKENSDNNILVEQAIQELDEKARIISEKEKMLDERERAIEIQENILQEKLKRIEEVSKKMAKRLDKFKDESEQKVAKVVTMLETMKPDAAAAYIESVDPFLAVEVLGRINVQKAAKIMNKVDKKISARLSELFTGFKMKLDKYEEPATSKPKG